MGVQPGIDTSAQHRYDVAPARGPVDDTGEGWLAFAVVLLAIAGTLNIIGGIAAIGDSKFFVQDTEYVLGGLNSWGWTMLIIGIIQVLTGWGIYRRNQLARWIGVLALSLNAIAVLLFLPAYPFWSLSIFALDLISIYGLIVYGGRSGSYA